MKSKILFLFILLSAALIAATYTKQNSRVSNIKIDVGYVNGLPATVTTNAFLVSSFVNQADPTDVIDDQKWSQVSFDLLDANLAATTITAGGKTVTYPQLAALLRQAALDRANAAGIQ